MSDYGRKKTELIASWTHDGRPLRLSKTTVSNLFRYQRRAAAARRLSLGQFNEVIGIDANERTLDVEGLTTFETIVTRCLPHGLLPGVCPELKHITVGGATVGIGIESTCFRHGFVHDGLLEADVLLPGGTVVTATADNEHSDLFRALPNSYGTLGYILRAKIALFPAQSYVHLHVQQFDGADVFLDAMRAATETPDIDYVEGLFFEDERYFLMTGRSCEDVPYTDDILRRSIFYKLVQSREDIYLRTKDYIFRYDPEWFWNIPDSWPYALFRRFAPARWRNSSFYTRYVALKERLRPNAPSSTEPLIQDWEVPYERGAELIRFCLKEVSLGGLPWAAVPIRTPRRPTLYPIEPNTLYFNLGCYCQVRKPPGKGDYYYTKIMDDKCFGLGGIKMLYSSTFLDEAAFDRHFNGPAYRELKRKYDPDGRAPTLYEKVAATAG